MFRFDSPPATARRPERPCLDDLTAVFARRGSKAELASMTHAQREAAASFVEAARPWLDFGLNHGEPLSVDDILCLLGIVADGLRLQFEPERPG